MTIKPDRYPGYTRRDLAEACGVRIDTVDRWIKGGHIAIHRLGPNRVHIRITEDEFDRVVASMRLPRQEGA